MTFKSILEKILIGALLFTSTTVAYAALLNGSFEESGYQRELLGWNWWTKGNAPAGWQRDSHESCLGAYSIRIWKDVGVQGDIYGAFEQKLTNLPKGALIHIGAMIKGKSVERVWMGDFNNRIFTPNGDFGWQRVYGSIQLAPEQTEYTLMFGIDGKTQSLWIDDVRVIVDGESMPEDNDWLFIRRMDNRSTDTGFLLLVRNPLEATKQVTLQYRLCDPYGLPIEEKSVPVEVAPGQQKRIFIPVKADQRVALMTASVVDKDGKILSWANDFLAVEPPSLAPIAGSDRLGVDEINFAYVSGDSYTRLLDLMAAAGVTSLRGYEMDRCYDDAQKTIDPSRFTRFLNDLHSRNITVMPILAYSPTWASTAGPFANEWDRRMTMPRLDVWKTLVEQYVRTHGFKEVEVWNEPNGGFWNSYPKDITYGKLVTATCETVKKIDPSIVVVAGSTNSDSPGWPESVIKAAGRHSLDAISFHPYRLPVSDPTPPCVELPRGQWASYPRVIEEMDRMSSKYNNGKPLPLYITEYGFEELGPDGLPYLQGNPLYKSEAVARMSLTLAGLGVRRSYLYEFRDLHPAQFGIVRKDLTIKPAWWAFRAMSEHAAARLIGKFEQLTPDLFALTMTGDTNVLAVWTAENPAIVTIRKPIKSAKDLFSLDVLAVPVKDSPCYVIPAGSVLYLTGDNKLNTKDIQAVVALVPKSHWALAGEKCVFDVVAQPNAPKKLTSGLPGIVDFTVEATPGLWTTGKLEFKIAGCNTAVPVFIPVSEKTTAELVFDAKCNPAIRLTNLDKREVEAKISMSAGNGLFSTKKTAKVPSHATVEEPMSARPKSTSEGLDVVADVEVGQRKWSFARTLFYAGVKKNDGIKVDGTTDDWASLPMIDLVDWDKNAGEKPVDPADMSAQLGITYDTSRLYVLVKVKDDIHYQKFAPAESWMGDSVQLAFDIDPMGKHDQIEMGFAVDENGRYMFNSRQMNVNVDEVKANVTRKDNITAYEMAFPFSLLNVKPQTGSRLGFSLLVNENDTGAREGYLRWSKGIGESKDPQNYGQLLIE